MNKNMIVNKRRSIKRYKIYSLYIDIKIFPSQSNNQRGNINAEFDYNC